MRYIGYIGYRGYIGYIGYIGYRGYIGYTSPLGWSRVAIGMSSVPTTLHPGDVHLFL